MEAKKNKIIGVDLDEVLAELLDYILKYNYYKIGSKDVIREDIKDYYIHKIPNLDITSEQAIKWFREPIFNDFDKLEINPLDGAKDKLLELKSKGYKFIVLTARIEEIFGDYTRVWVEKYFPDIFEDILFANHFNINHKDKLEVCLEKSIEVMIEDNYLYALDLARAGIKTYLLEKPWNSWQKENHENIIRIKSWEEFLK